MLPSARTVTNTSVNLVSSEFKADPFPFYARLRSEQPVCCVKLTVLPRIREAWLVTRYDDVVSVLKDPRFAKDRAHSRVRPWFPPFVRPLQHNMLDQDEPDHCRLRGAVYKAFTPAMVDGLRQRIQAIADRLLDAAAEGKGSMDLMRDFALPLPLTVIAELLGIPEQDREKFHYWTKAALRPFSVINILRAVPAMWAFIRYFRRLFPKLKVTPREGLLSALVNVSGSGDQLSDDELLGMAMVLVIAGHETTANLIASGSLALVEHPEQMELLRQTPSLIGPAVEELLRYTSPVEMATTRFAREDVAVNGTTIPRRALVMAVLASANRDEKQFDRPDELDLTRLNNRHVAFGLGPHFCLGAPLARVEGQIAISTLLRRTPNLHLACPAKSLRWRATPVLRGLESLPVRF